MSKSLIKWSVLSTMLSGSDNSIRRDKIPKKYEKEVNGLIDAIGEWEKETKKASVQERGSIGSFWKDAKKELPKQTKGSYSDVDVFICRMYRYDIGRTKDGKWVDMKNEPIEDVVLWAYMPKIGNEFKECFNCL